jgi:hypothetical protein
MALRATADKIKKGASRPSRGLLWLLVCFYLVLLVCRLGSRRSDLSTLKNKFGVT